MPRYFKLILISLILIVSLAYNNLYSQVENKSDVLFIEGNVALASDWGRETASYTENGKKKYQPVSAGTGYAFGFSLGGLFEDSFGIMIDIGYWKTKTTFKNDITSGTSSVLGNFDYRGNYMFVGPKFRIYSPLIADNLRFFVSAGYLLFIPNNHTCDVSTDTMDYKMEYDIKPAMGFRGEIGLGYYLSRQFSISLIIGAELVSFSQEETTLKSTSKIDGSTSTTTIKYKDSITADEAAATGDTKYRIKELLDASNFSIKIGFSYFLF